MTSENSSIVFFDKKTDIGTRVVLWDEDDGFEASSGNYGYKRYINSQWKEPTGEAQLKQVIKQFIVHYDAAWNSTQCYSTVESRGLSCQFLLDLDGTIYQTLDLKYRAYQALGDDKKANDRSIGVEIANIANHNKYKKDGDRYYVSAQRTTSFSSPENLSQMF